MASEFSSRQSDIFNSAGNASVRSCLGDAATPSDNEQFISSLLLSAQRREAIKAALDGLKADPAGQKKQPAASEAAGLAASKGSITLQELRLPLKADFVCSTANKPGTLSTGAQQEPFLVTFPGLLVLMLVCLLWSRVHQVFLLHHDPGRSREHRGHSTSQHTPRPQRRHAHLPYQVHHVRPSTE